jgi:uncharacterized protein
MRNALHEQLLKAGLVDEKRLDDVARDKRRERGAASVKRPIKNAPPPKVAPPTPAVRATKTDPAALKKEAQSARRVLEREIVQVIKANRHRHNDGDEVYNFVDGAKVGRIYVTAETHAGLTAGELAIVRLRTRYAVVSTLTATSIAAKAPEYVVVARQDSQPVELDPAYAAHPIPDDLRW